ncbi:universal stress protein [uncultured Thiocystis sp.]|jgi:nucleotide-binding universal stress UspA family protein|uniref:universal stress protein n=1 Tax=uncultured Thiocystis sp. TaxID=1202134 RepID=UPI0025FE1477|nr:universal stress protein [uncultured Thiocystis sp.]
MKRFKNILYVIASGDLDTSAFARAISLAENNQARLTLVDVIPSSVAGTPMSGDEPCPLDTPTTAISSRMDALASLIEPFRSRLDVHGEVLTGSASAAIVRAVLRQGYGLVIKPIDRPSFVERLLGGEDMNLLRKCPCPVWLTQPSEPSDYKTILAAVDVDPDDVDGIEPGLNQQILALSSSLALSDFATLHLVHVWDAPGDMIIRTRSESPDAVSMSYLNDVRLRHEGGLDRLTKQLKAHLGPDAYDYLAPRVHLRQGMASTVIPEMAEQLRADLVVMGTVVRTGIAGFLLGNTAEAMLNRLKCSLLVVKPPGFVSPMALEEPSSDT